MRTAVVTGRCCEQREALKSPSLITSTGSLVLIFQGNQSIVGGHGEIFDRFRETGVLCGYPGEGTPIAVSSDENYDAAPLKVIQFHETYQNLRYDVNHSKASMLP